MVDLLLGCQPEEEEPAVATAAEEDLPEALGAEEGASLGRGAPFFLEPASFFSHLPEEG